MRKKKIVISLAVIGILAILIVLRIRVVDMERNKPIVPQKPEFNSQLMLKGINEVRAENGKAAMTEDSKLDLAAQAKANKLVQFNTREHQLPNGDPIFKELEVQYPQHGFVAENLAECTKSDTEVVAGWENSPSHFQAMVGDYDGWGAAVAQNPKDHCQYTVNYFIKYAQ